MADRIYSGMLRLLPLLLLAGTLAGCAGEGEFREDYDPWEGFNRGVYNFNEGLDKAVLKPVAKGYQAVTPEVVDAGVSNFFKNLGDILVVVNDLLQLKGGQALSDSGRIVLNTTVGIFGFFDVASGTGLEKHDEDFGQTLGFYGVEPGPYLVLPVLGPSNVRDGVGTAGTLLVHPVNYFRPPALRYSLVALDLVDSRADLLNASKVLEQAALDRYAFLRDAYLQKRRDQVYDGNPPPEEDFLDDEDEPAAE